MLCTSFEYYVSNLRSGYQVALGAVVGLTIPSDVTWFKGSMITYALAVTMLGMGLGLDASDFKSAITSPRVILTGVALQYTVMPFLAFALSRALPIPTPFAVGPACPPIAVATVALICASVIGASSAAIRSAGPLLLLAVALLHSGGFALGFGFSKLAGFKKETSRTISIEARVRSF